jgi:hypothetical protein
MTKPTVHFVAPARFFNAEIMGTNEIIKLASVWALDHPRLSEGLVRTSIVLNINDDGSFETLNTLYVPSKGKKYVRPKSLNQEYHSPVTEDSTTPV